MTGALCFNPKDPFPLIETNTVSYAEEKLHAAQVDVWLGIRAEEIEKQIALKQTSKERNREFWIGKSVETFSTPYTELRSIIEDLRPVFADSNEPAIVDLGAGYGRMAHVVDAHAPLVRFVGYELLVERQAEGQRVIALRGLGRAVLKHQDVTSLEFESRSASVFFLYDFGSRADVETCIENLKRLATQRTITVIARGGRSREVIEKQHHWLSQVVKPLHRKHYSIYRSGGRSLENS